MNPLLAPDKKKRAKEHPLLGASLEGRGAEPKMVYPSYAQYKQALEEYDPGYNQAWSPDVNPAGGWDKPSAPYYRNLPTHTFEAANANGAIDPEYLRGFSRERLLDLMQRISRGVY